MDVKWYSVEDRLPKRGDYLVEFCIEILGVETPFMEKTLYASAFFEPCVGWSIENRYIFDCRYAQPYQSPRLKVLRWLYSQDEIWK